MPGPRGRLNRWLAHVFPEKRLFLQTARSTGYLRLTPVTQAALAAGTVLVFGWLVVATAAVVLELVSADGRERQASVLSDAYESRLAELAAERDQRAAEALSAQARFQMAMEQIGRQQSEILGAIEANRELAAGLDVLRARLHDAVAQRDRARAESEALRGQVEEVSRTLTANGASDLAETLETVVAALADAVRVRDLAVAERDELASAKAELELRIAMMTRRQEEMLAELEYAVRTSFEPLEALFEAADLDIDSLLASVRRDYSGLGGPRSSVSMSSRSFAHDDTLGDRFDELLVDLDRMNMLRIAAGRIPYGMPVMDSHRLTSGFGYRRDPKNGRRRMHAGIDLAAPRGTPIYATADGVVISAGSEGGYGKTVRIRHEFGFETLYAHKSAIHVREGQRVSRGDHIGDMGATGRVTGVHLHYEVHLNGRPVNPMVYLEAARDVF